MRIWGIGIVRNEVDLVRVNVLHHLSEGLDRLVLVDNGSTDGTYELLQHLGRISPVECRSYCGAFRQDRLLTELAREAHARGAQWVLPIDADEFWHAPGSTLQAVLSVSSAGTLRAKVVNFVQRSDRLQSSTDALLTMTRRTAAPVGPIERIADHVSSGRAAFVEIQYPPKSAYRTTPDLRIGWGNHSAEYGRLPHEDTDAIVCLHAPLRSKAVLLAKAAASGVPRGSGAYLDVAWHVRRWRGMSPSDLDLEWDANSHDDGHLRVAGQRRTLVEDTRLRDAVRPWVESTTVPSRLRRKAGGQQPRIWGVSVVRNEVDIIQVNLRHHLALGLERILVADNGSRDGTDTELRNLATDGRIEWRSIPGAFRQEEIVSGLAREAFARGATWVLPLDADEFWSSGAGSLPGLLADSQVDALGCKVINFVQERTQLKAGPEALARVTMRPGRQVGPVEQVRDLVSARTIGFVEGAYPPKWIRRAAPDLSVRTGNHSIAGLSRVQRTAALVCLHVPLRSRSVLEAQIEHGQRLDQAALPRDEGWHVRRWRQISEAGGLEDEWRANSHVDGRLDVFGTPHTLVTDTRLRDAVMPWIGGDRVPDELVSSPVQERPAAELHALVEHARRIPGWFEVDEARLLIDTTVSMVKTLGRSHVIVEVGSYLGRSTVVMAQVVRAMNMHTPIHAIDPHQGTIGAVDSDAGLETKPPTFDAFLGHLDTAGVEDLVVPHRQRSVEVDWRLPIGLLFVDGLHDALSVRQDLNCFESWIADGGFLVFHDDSGIFPGVQASVRQMLESDRYRRVGRAGTLIVLRKGASD